MRKDVTADVTLENIGQFEFAEYTNGNNEVKDTSMINTAKIQTAYNAYNLY